FALSVFGLITRADLNCMREIRNAFAHARISLKFTTHEVKATCKSFQRKRFPKNATPRTRYLETAEQITHDFLCDALDPKRPSPAHFPKQCQVAYFLRYHYTPSECVGNSPGSH